MISGEDESSSVLNGRLRPRKTTAPAANPSNKSYKSENKIDLDKHKKYNTPSKASPKNPDDLITKAEPSTTAQLLCPYCDRKFSTKLSASKHVRRIHLSTSKQDSFIQCLFCSHSEAEHNDAIRHMVDSHPNQYFACLDCHTRFLSTSELAEHKLNVCEKQAYRSKLRQKTSPLSKKSQKKLIAEDQYPIVDKDHKLEQEYNSLVISCELKPSQAHDALDIEDNITTNLILPSNKTLSNAVLEKNAVIVLDEIQWKRRIPPNFSFHNADADQILSRLGVVHRSPRVGESTRREWLKMIDDTSQKFEKCFDTNFYARVASNVQENLARFLDGSFNFSPDPDKIIKTRKSKSSTIINTAEGFPILLPHEQYSRNRFDGYMPRAIAPKHKWKWDSTENDKSIIIDANVMKRDNHVNNCIITLVSSLDIWTQLRMRRKFEGIFCKAIIEKIEKQNIIGRELKEILESREIPCSSTQVVECSKPVAVKESSEFPWILGLSAVQEERGRECTVAPAPAELSGEWVRPRCYVCCACGDQTRDARALSSHMTSHHPNAQVQHYEIVGESLLNADILKHLYVPPSQMSNRTRPLRGFRDCTKCKKSVTVEELHQHMLDCAGDTPTVRRKCRSRLFGVRRRRPRLPDNTIRKKMRKDLRTRHNQKGLLRTRPRIRTEVGDAETIRKMIADLPAKRHRQASGPAAPVLRSRRKLDIQRKTKIKRHTSDETRNIIPKIDTNIDEDDQPLKPKAPEKIVPTKKRFSSRVVASRNKKKVEKATTRQHSQDATKNSEPAAKPQQLSCSENTSQRVNISSEGNTPAGDRTNSNGVDGGRGEDSKQLRDDPQKEDQKVPGPSLLKHSINNITAPACKKNINLQQLNVLPQQDNFGENDRYNQINILEKEVVVVARPDKPPLGTNQKRNSKKLQRSIHLKVQSLSNCIEKIAHHTISKTLKGDLLPDAAVENNDMQKTLNNDISDSNAAIVSRSSGDTGLTINLIPPRSSEEPTLEIIKMKELNGYGDPNKTYDASRSHDPNKIYRRNSDTDTQRKSNDMLMLAVSESTDFVSPRPKRFGGMRRKSSVQSDSDQSNLATLQQQPNPWLVNMPYLLDHHRLEYMTKGFPTPEALINHQDIRAFQNTPTSLSVPSYGFATSGYNPPDLHYQNRGENIPLREEMHPHLLMCNTQQNQIPPVSPQMWNNNPTHGIYSVQSMLPSMLLSPTNAQIIPSRQTSRKRVSESSETDNIHRNFDCDTSIQNLRRRSAEAVNLELYSPYASGFSKVPCEYNKSFNYTSFTQDSFERHYKTMPNISNDNHSLSETVRNDCYQDETENYKKATNKKKQNIKSRKSIENIDDVNPPIQKTIETTEPRYLVPARPTEPQVAKPIPLPVTSTMRKSIDSQNYYTDRRQIDLPLVTKELIAPQKQTSYEISHKRTSQVYCEKYQEVFVEEVQTECPAEEPLDLSGKKIPAVINEQAEITCKENNKKVLENYNETENQDNLNESYVTLDLSKKACELKNDSFIDTSTGSLQRYIPELSDCYKGADSANEHHKRATVPNNWAIREKDINDKYIKDYQETVAPKEDNPEAECGLLANSQLKQGPGAAPSPNMNYLTTNVRTLDQLNNSNEKGTSASWENRDLDATSMKKVTGYSTMRGSYDSHDQNTCHFQAESSNPDQNIAKKDVQNSYTTDFQNQIMESKNEKAAKALDIEDLNEANKNSSSFEQDPETAKKIAMLPKELVAILGTVPKEKKYEFVNVISQFVAKPSMASNHEMNAPIINVHKPQNVTRPTEDTQAAMIPICVTSPNESDNRLTVNTALLPPSSILPKKRHSPSARMNLQDAKNNATSLLSRPPPNPEPSVTISHIPNYGINTFIQDNDSNPRPRNASFYEQLPTDVSNQISTLDENESKCFVGNIIDLTDEDLNYSETTSTILTPNTILPTQESILRPQVATKQSSEKTANLRAVRIKPPLLRKSISDDKAPTLGVHHSCESRLRDLNTAQISQPDCDNVNEHSNISPIPINEVTNAQNVTKTGSEELNFILVPSTHSLHLPDMSKSPSISVSPAANRLELNNAASSEISDGDDKLTEIGNVLQKNTECDSFLGSKHGSEGVFLEPSIIDNDSSNIQNHDSCGTIDVYLKSSLINARFSNMKNDSHTKTDISAPFVKDEQESHILITSNLTHPELTGDKNEASLKIGNNKIISIESRVPCSQENEDGLNFCQNVMSTVPPNEKTQFDNTTRNNTLNTKLSENEDSDDDVLLAVIVKKRQLDHQSTSLTELNSVEKLINVNEEADKSPEKQIISTKPGLVSINYTLVKLFNNEEKSTIVDKTLKSNKNNPDEVQSPNANELSENHDQVDVQNNVIEQDIELKSKVDNEANRTNKSIKKSTKKTDEVMIDKNARYGYEYLVDTVPEVPILKPKNLIAKEKTSRKKQKRRSKVKQAKISLQTIVKNKIDVQLEDNDLKVHPEIVPETNTNPNFIANDENKSVNAYEAKNVLVIPENTQIILQNPLLETVEMGSKKSSTKLKKIGAAPSSVTDSELVNLNDTKRSALRRSKRGKSMYLDDKSAVDDGDINNSIAETLEIHTASETETKNSESIKRKKSCTGTSRKKKIKSNPILMNDGECSNNNESLIKKHIRTDLDASSKNISLEANDIQNSFEFDDDSSDINMKSTEKRKLENTVVKDSYGSKPKKSKAINKTDTARENPELQANDTPCSDIYTNNKQDYDIDSEITEKVPLNVNSSGNKLHGITVPQDSNEKIIQNEREFYSPETRTACYNRPVIYKQILPPIVSVKKTDNYDPYDIDFEDMAESTQPIIKRKVSKTVCSNTTSKSSKKPLSAIDTAGKSHQQEITEIVQTNIDATAHNISDSDSSINDVPLQKYLEEKEKWKAEEGQLSSHIEKEHEQNSTQILNSVYKNKFAPQNVEEDLNGNDKKQNKNEDGIKNASLINYIDQKNETSIAVISPIEIDSNVDKSSNVLNRDIHETDVEYSTAQPNTKQKRNKRSSTANKTECSSTTNDIDQQLTSDKFMENFGFYSVRQHRKSNLLASKKISETFRESDDIYVRSKDRQKKSTHSDNKKASDGGSTSKAASDGGSTSKAAQETTKMNPNTKSYIEQLSTPKIAVDVTKTVDEMNDRVDEEEVDLLTAQKILESEEVRKLENDLFSGLKEAANANAGKTFRLSHLRTNERRFDEVVRHNISDSIQTAAELKTVETQESSKKSANKINYKEPEYKELMYPDEEVNIYEDKYDIIKRRRTQAAVTKQSHSVDEPRTSSKNRKKPDRKNSKKSPKKPSHQVSQVPTKGALKGFDGIKVSIPTQDLILPPNISPPRPATMHKQPKSNTKRTDRETKNSGYSSKSETDKNINTPDKDVYEFKDDERPVTKGYRIARPVDKCCSSSESEDKKDKRERDEKDDKIKYECESTGLNEKEKQKKYKGKGKGKGKRTSTEDKNTNKEYGPSNILENTNEDEKHGQNNHYNESTLTENLSMDFHENTKEDANRLTSANNVLSDVNNIEDVDNSDLDDQTTCIPGSSGFVPDRNDESSYDSDSSAPHYPGLDYACTCPSDADSDDSEIERGCDNSSCRYIHLHAAKNAVMGKIFKNNALRCDKSSHSPPSPKPKPDLDLLFDSLLEKTTTNNATAVRTPTSPIPGPSWASDYYFANDGRDMSNVDDGFSSPNRPGSEQTTEKAFTRTTPPAAFQTDLFDMDASFANFGETTRELTDEERCTLVSLQRIQMGHPARPIVPVTSAKPNAQLDDTSNKVKDMAPSPKKRRSDVGYTSRSDQKASKSSRKLSKKHKTHHKSKKVSESEKNLGLENITPRLNHRTHSSTFSNRVVDTESEKNRLIDKESPSRKSDEGISTSHDNSADAYELGREDDAGAGVAKQRARRKCTVGKQNVLVEHWSSSDSDSIPRANRTANSVAAGRRRKGKKQSVIKKWQVSGKEGEKAFGRQEVTRQSKKREEVRGRGEESDDDGSEQAGPSSRASCSKLRAVPGPSLRARPAARDHASSEDDQDNASRDKNNKPHGWMAGNDHKRLVALLVRGKGKAEGEVVLDDDDDDEEVPRGGGGETEEPEQADDQIEQDEATMVFRLSELAEAPARAELAELEEGRERNRREKARARPGHSRPRTKQKRENMAKNTYTRTVTEEDTTTEEE